LRKSFSVRASIELTDVRSEKQFTAFTSNLSQFGCYVITGNPLPQGAEVSLRIMRGGTTFTAFGKVVYAKPKHGMRIGFAETEPDSEAI
jgi:PilZ domain